MSFHMADGTKVDIHAGGQCGMITMQLSAAGNLLPFRCKKMGWLRLTVEDKSEAVVCKDCWPLVAGPTDPTVEQIVADIR